VSACKRHALKWPDPVLEHRPGLGELPNATRSPSNHHDEITLILIEPDDGSPPLVRTHWPLRHTTAAAKDYPAVAASIVRIIAESATALARHKAGGRL
jgi:hypothetical protein